MGWRDLLQTATQRIVLPWVGGRLLRTDTRTWTLDGELPIEHGWYTFALSARTARPEGPIQGPSALGHLVCGYLAGDRMFPDGIRVDPDPSKIVRASERVHLIEEGLDRFARVVAGRAFESGPLIYQGPDMPLGPEDEVLRAWLDRKEHLHGVRHVAPALDAAFRLESWRRAQSERRRAELARRRKEKQERLAREQRVREIVREHGDGAGRRAIARVDFFEAARAALAVGGAELLDEGRAARAGEKLVRLRLDGRRYECTCDAHTLRIIDAGICLTDEKTGERGDTYFTLESLPAVIRQAQRERRLVVFRHVDD